MCKGKQGMCSPWMRRTPCHTCFTALPLAAAAASFFCFSCRQQWGQREAGAPIATAGGQTGGLVAAVPAGQTAALQRTLTLNSLIILPACYLCCYRA